MTDSTGINVLNSYKYLAFGSILTESETVLNPFKFVGREGYYFDVDLGYFLLRARYYNPVSSQFLSRPTGKRS